MCHCFLPAPYDVCRNDTDTIESAKIDAGATIHMVLSLRGGSV